MTVYVESNFVLEIALGQKQSEAAEPILVHAERGGVELVIPSCALLEPFSTVRRQGDRRRELRNRLNEEIRSLERSSPHASDTVKLKPMADLFAEIEDREKKRLDETVQRVIEVATIIEINAMLYGEALALSVEFDFKKMPDAIVGAAVLNDLAEPRGSDPHYFATRDAEDFGEDKLRERFEALGCSVVHSFDQCAQRLGIQRSRLIRSD